ncbi:unnamed protein product [Adineta ricciae]|uniref:Uncharacterized protein n=2 Tax=Adineta ricciae TaxID=249248 RepID=A0A813ZKD2_ADIRI|nr:unnamed protein product [Adineta ricciae]
MTNGNIFAKNNKETKSIAEKLTFSKSNAFNMSTDNTEEIPSQSFYVHNEFPFVFIPTTHFAYANNHPQTFNDNNPMTSEVIKEEEEGEGEEDTADNQVEENDELTDLRISQPKYSQLLRDLDFSETRMYDVTKLLSDETSHYAIVDENQNLASELDNQQYSSNIQSTIIDPMREQENLTNKASQDFEHTSIHIPDGLSEEYDNHPAVHIHIEEKSENDQEQLQTEHENITLSPKFNPTSRFSTQNSTRLPDETLSSIPRLNPNSSVRVENHEQTHEFPLNWNDLLQGADGYMQSPTVVIIAQPIDDIHSTPPKPPPPQPQQQFSPPPPPPPPPPHEKPKPVFNTSPKQRPRHRIRQLSASSETDSVAEYIVHRSKHKLHATSQPHLSIEEDYSDINTRLKQVFNDRARPYTSASDILFRRLTAQPPDRTSPSKKKSHHHHHHHHHRSSSSRHINQEDNNQSFNNETWLLMLEKLEREHKERLEKQQKQYETYMQELEEKMKQRFEEYLSSTNSLNLQESKSESFDAAAYYRRLHESNDERYRTSAHPQPQRSYYSLDKRPSFKADLCRSQSREDISIVRTELSAKHAKHISDLKLYYEHEIEELNSQLNNLKMGQASSTHNRQSLETLERLTNENLRLQDEMKDLRHSVKVSNDENTNLKRQIEDLRNQMNTKDLDFKAHQRRINELQKQIDEERNLKERQDEKIRFSDKQALLYRQENEKLTSDLNLTRERLLRLEERYRDLENETKTYRPSGFSSDNNTQRSVDNSKYGATIPMNIPTSREYGRFTVTTSRYSTSTVTSPRTGNRDSARYTSNESEDLFRHCNSPRPLLTLNDYINDKPKFPPAYVPPTRPLYSPRKSPSNLHSADQMPDLIDNQMKQSEHLEERFDELLKKKRDLEARINRIPMRGLTKSDRQLYDVLEREIERVDQQISSVKLELRKLNILRTH